VNLLVTTALTNAGRCWCRARNGACAR